VNVHPETAASTVPGLFAAGEAAAGLHGANRLGGNSLSDLLVFGRRAGGSAAEHAKKTAAPTLSDAQIDEAERELLAPFERATGDSPYDIHSSLQESMQKLVGIFRTEEDLKQALVDLAKLKQRVQNMRVEGSRLFNPGWHLSQDLRNMLICSEAVTLGALARQESRGAHSRIDFPKTDDIVWGKQNNIVSRQGDGMLLEQRPKPEMPEELAKILAEEVEVAAKK
jgi:succinate dehydrogenase / fumarate reductase flavoprotein subunit